MNYKPLLPVFIIFAITTILCLIIPSQLATWGINATVVLVGNIVLLIATVISFIFYHRSFTNNNVQFFMRMIYSAMFTKMLICIVTAFIYIVTYKKNVSKGAIFTCMFLYFVYTFVELATVLKLSKEKKNA